MPDDYQSGDDDHHKYESADLVFGHDRGLRTSASSSPMPWSTQ
jgi:hypothetical protein